VRKAKPVAACAAATAPRLRGAVQDENLELQANLRATDEWTTLALGLPSG
jgi:hypothetical protein